MPDFIEFEFSLPFGDLVFENWSAHPEVADGRAFEAVAGFLGLDLTAADLFADFESRPIHSNEMHLFFSPTMAGCLLLIDFFIDPTDQCGMVKFGVRCRSDDEAAMFELLKILHRKNGPRTPLAIDWSNQRLRRVAEDPAFFAKGRRVIFRPDWARLF